jgi:hypothetical protein
MNSIYENRITILMLILDQHEEEIHAQTND